MLARYDEAEAERYARHHARAAGEVGAELGRRIYTIQLLARLRPVVGRGGISGSVKAAGEDAFGTPVEALYLGSFGPGEAPSVPADLATLRCEPLRRASGAARAEMPRLLRAAALADAPLPEPWQALVHAQLPGRYVDCLACEEVVQLGCQVDPARAVALALGDDVLVVPDLADPLALAQTLARRWDRYREAQGHPPRAVLLGRRGAVCWGETAQESYAAMAELVRAAARAMAGSIEPVSAIELVGEGHDEARRAVALALRGALRKASGRGWLAHWRHGPTALRLSHRPDLGELVQRGPATAAIAEATGHAPLTLGDLGGGTPAGLAAAAAAALTRYAAAPRDLAPAPAGHDGGGGSTLEPWPRVVVVRDLGVVCLGTSLVEAMQTADAFEHGAQIAQIAARASDYVPLGPATALAATRRAAGRAPRPDGSLAGLVAVVTGAGSGIGLATFKAMLAAGAHVLIADDDHRVLEAVSEWPERHHPGRYATVACDVTSEAQCRAAVEVACNIFGGVDVLVSSAGCAPSGALHSPSGDAALRRSLDVNLLGHQRMARAFVEALLAQQSGGVLLFNASRTAFSPGPQSGPYAVPKAALLALMRQYAVDLGPHAIRANAVNADRIRTKLLGQLSEPVAESDPLSPSQYFRANLLQRETTAEQVAEAFVYLATAEATTGCVITVDGGNPAAFPR